MMCGLFCWHCYGGQVVHSVGQDVLLLLLANQSSGSPMPSLSPLLVAQYTRAGIAAWLCS